jgi:hypothetical protein
MDVLSVVVTNDHKFEVLMNRVIFLLARQILRGESPSKRAVARMLKVRKMIADAVPMCGKRPDEDEMREAANNLAEYIVESAYWQTRNGWRPL